MFNPDDGGYAEAAEAFGFDPAEALRDIAADRLAEALIAYALADEALMLADALIAYAMTDEALALAEAFDREIEQDRRYVKADRENKMSGGFRRYRAS